MSEKIIITGHTKGLGKAIYEWHKNQNHDITGISRSTGHDIKNTMQIVDVVKNYDIFINNAYHKGCQFDICYELSQLWKKDNNKTIINISSRAGDFSEDIKVKDYNIYKKMIDDLSSQIQIDKNYKCNIINIKPGYLENQKNKSEMYMTYLSFIKVYKFIYDNKNLVNVDSIRFCGLSIS